MKHGGQWSCMDAILNKNAGYHRRVCGFERPCSDENKISCDHATVTKSRRSAAPLDFKSQNCLCVSYMTTQLTPFHICYNLSTLYKTSTYTWWLMRSRPTAMSSPPSPSKSVMIPGYYKKNNKTLKNLCHRIIV